MAHAEATGWREIPRDELPQWNGRLRQTDAMLFQYPYWNEPLRRMHFRPRYLVYGTAEGDEAYVCLLTLGIPFLQIGLVHRGPVNLRGPNAVSQDVLEALRHWVLWRGFVFLRFTHSDADRLQQILSTGRSEPVNAFPFYGDLSGDLVVEQLDDDAALLARFQPIARQEIKKGGAVGYEIRAEASEQAMRAAYHLFEGLGERKGLQYRPLESYLDLVRLAAPHQGLFLYQARFEGTLVETILLLRDRDSSYYISGALEVAAVPGKVSPSCLLHWTAMRELHHQGIRYYNLGTRSGPVYQFKRKFRPVERSFPSPVTWVLNPLLYAVWSAVIHRLGPSIRPLLRRLVSRSR